MEFNEKLQKLRKGKKLTQEELAQDLFVSRTAISKWESGRGYPSIDSLKEISRYFSVSIDELICPQEIISAAEEEKQEYAGRTVSFICGALDLFAGILLLVPVFGDHLEIRSSGLGQASIDHRDGAVHCGGGCFHCSQTALCGDYIFCPVGDQNAWNNEAFESSDLWGRLIPTRRK